MMPVSMVTDTRLKGLKQSLAIGLGIWSNEGDSLRKKIKLRQGQRSDWEEIVRRPLFHVRKLLFPINIPECDTKTACN